MPAAEPPDSRNSSWASAGVGLSLGWTILAELLAVIGLFGYAGYRLDRALGTRPVLFAVLMVVGYAGGVYHVYLTVRHRTEKDVSGQQGG